MHPTVQQAANEVFEELKSMQEDDFKKEMKLHALLQMKTVMVTLTKEDEEGNRHAMRISGEDATKWAEAVDGQGIFCHAHGMKFPELNWEEI